MSKEEIFAEITQALGKVPGFFESIPEESLEAEWALFKRFELSPSSLEPKVRELIGIAVAASEHCWYCANFHTGLARFHGATDDEVQEAVHFAKFSTGWSTYLNGLVYDQEKFLSELHEVGAYLDSQRKQQAKAA
jgi:AhpD family alkylhydroperoxidase